MKARKERERERVKYRPDYWSLVLQAARKAEGKGEGRGIIWGIIIFRKKGKCKPDYQSNVISVLQAAPRQTRYTRSWPDTFRGVFRGLSCRRLRRRPSSSVAITRPEWDKARGRLAMHWRGMWARKRGGEEWRITRITRTTLRASRTVRGAGPDSICSPVNPWASLEPHSIFRIVSYFYLFSIDTFSCCFGKTRQTIQDIFVASNFRYKEYMAEIESSGWSTTLALAREEETWLR